MCKIYSAVWEETDDRLVFTIKADRFLRNMVRAIVGTMIETGTGKMSLKEFEEIILAKDRCRAGKSAPAKGLFLVDIEYPGEIFTLHPSEGGYSTIRHHEYTVTVCQKLSSFQISHDLSAWE